MATYIVPDADRIGSSEPISIPDHGITAPVKLTESGRTRKEWEDLIKKHKLPLVIHEEKEGADD
jgi:hypothetical protein